MRRWMLGGFVAFGLAVAFAIAMFASPFASDAPDGMGRVAIDKGFDKTEKAHRLEDKSPVGGYAVKGVSDDRFSTGLAGGIGVVLTFGLGIGVFVVLRASRHRSDAPAPAPLQRQVSP